MLEITVGREAEPLLLLTGSVELYKVAGDILELVLGLLFQAVPGAGAELVDGRLNPLFAAVFRELVKGVDGDEDAVVVLVDELDHLLCRAVDLGTQEAAELSDSVVDMDDIVPCLYGGKFLEREGQFSGAGAVALEGIFVETVENLVIGEKAPFRTVVNESFMESSRGRSEGDFFLPLLENGMKAHGLFLRVRQEVNAVPLPEEFQEGGGDKVEILMIQSLGGTAEVKRCLRGIRRGGGGEFHAGESGESGGEFFGVNQLLHGLEIPFVGNHGRGGKALVGDRLHAGKHTAAVGDGNQRPFRHEVHQALARGAVGGDVGRNGHGVNLLFGQLCLDVEGAYGVDFVAEEVDAVREFGGVTEDVEDRAADSEMPRFIDIVDG